MLSWMHVDLLTISLLTVVRLTIRSEVGMFPYSAPISINDCANLQVLCFQQNDKVDVLRQLEQQFFHESYLLLQQ